jgi:hypothetical protein
MNLRKYYDLIKYCLKKINLSDWMTVNQVSGIFATLFSQPALSTGVVIINTPFANPPCW